jgi:Flp pilus assembly protein TadB
VLETIQAKEEEGQMELTDVEFGEDQNQALRILSASAPQQVTTKPSHSKTSQSMGISQDTAIENIKEF